MTTQATTAKPEWPAEYTQAGCKMFWHCPKDKIKKGRWAKKIRQRFGYCTQDANESFRMWQEQYSTGQQVAPKVTVDELENRWLAYQINRGRSDEHLRQL